MEKAMGRVAAWVAVMGSTLSACSTVYTQSDLDAAERQEDAEVRSEAAYDRQIGEIGGENAEAVEDEKEEVDRQSDL